MAVRTRILIRFRSPLLIPPNTRHDQVVGLVGGVDRAADLGHPQRDAVVVEEREREPVLVAVERAVRLADHHGVELAGRVLELGEQRGCLRAALPRDRAGLVHVEELGDDLPAARLDQRAGAGELPAARGLGVLLVLGGYPAVEGELDHSASPPGGCRCR